MAEGPLIPDQPHLPDRTAADVPHNPITQTEELCDLCGIENVIPCFSSVPLEKKPIRSKHASMREHSAEPPARQITQTRACACNHINQLSRMTDFPSRSLLLP